MGLYRHRKGEWRLRAQLRSGVRLSWAFGTQAEARPYEETLRRLRMSLRDDLIDALARDKSLLPRLHRLSEREPMSQIRLQDLLSPSGGHSIGVIAHEFFQYMRTSGSRSRFRRPFAPSTAEAYRRHIEFFFEWLQDGDRTPMESITSAVLSSYHQYRVNDDGVTPIGADRSISAIQALFSWASDEKRRTGGAVPNVEPLSHQKSPKLKEEARALNPNELVKIRGNVPPEVWPIFEVTLQLGLRISECLFLRVSDIDLEEQLVRIRPHPDRPLKTIHAEREVPFSEALRPILATQMAKAKGEHLWPKEWRTARKGGSAGLSRAGYHRLAKVWAKAAKAAGVTATIHDLRHTFGSRLADESVAPRDIAALLGHQSVVTTERYWKTKDVLSRKRDAVRRLGSILLPP